MERLTFVISGRCRYKLNKQVPNKNNEHTTALWLQVLNFNEFHSFKGVNGHLFFKLLIVQKIRPLLIFFLHGWTGSKHCGLHLVFPPCASNRFLMFCILCNLRWSWWAPSNTEHAHCFVYLGLHNCWLHCSADKSQKLFWGQSSCKASYHLMPKIKQQTGNK